MLKLTTYPEHIADLLNEGMIHWEAIDYIAWKLILKSSVFVKEATLTHTCKGTYIYYLFWTSMMYRLLNLPML